eukprot:scaffold5511_cov82-Skeletonema_menzelii.AAC.3
MDDDHAEAQLMPRVSGNSNLRHRLPPISHTITNSTSACQNALLPSDSITRLFPHPLHQEIDRLYPHQLQESAQSNGLVRCLIQTDSSY